MKTHLVHNQYVGPRLWLALLSIVAFACLCDITDVTPPAEYPTYTPYPTYTAAAAATQPPAEEPPAATGCEPRITATTDVFVRRGPSKAYGDVGALTTGQSTIVDGRSESQYGEWWYIVFASAPGGHGWVWGQAVTADCIPADLQVVAAPPLPQAQATNQPPAAQGQPTGTSLPPPSGGGSWGQTQADLAVTDLYTDNWPLGEIFVRITNNGPSSLTNISNNLVQFAIIVHPYSGAPQIVQGPSTTITISLNPGETKEYRTYISLDGVNNWYEVSAEIVPVTVDPNPGNNTYSETFPPPP